MGDDWTLDPNPQPCGIQRWTREGRMVDGPWGAGQLWDAVVDGIVLPLRFSSAYDAMELADVQRIPLTPKAVEELKALADLCGQTHHVRNL